MKFSKHHGLENLVLAHACEGEKGRVGRVVAALQLYNPYYC